MLNINKHSLDSPPKELPLYALRLEVQRIIEHYAEVYQCPKDIITTAMYCIVGTLCGKHVTLDDGKYRNHPNMWICHIAPSGSNKSSPVRALMEPMNREESKRYKEYREKYKDFKKTADEEEPTLNQLTVSDVTPEGLYKVLEAKGDTNDGLLLYRDEIKGFIDDMGRYHNSGEVSNYLSIWDGVTLYINRKTQQPMYIENPFLCMMGGIQPDAFADAFKKEFAEVGFVQRWLYVYPDKIKKAYYSEATLEADYVAAWNEVFTKLLSINDMMFTLSPEAKQAYIDYFNETKEREDDNDLYQASLLSKLRIYVLKWCAITHVLASTDSAGAGQYFALPGSMVISADEMHYSIDCMRYFEYCGIKALGLINGGMKKPKLTQEQLIKQLASCVGIKKVNITKFAEGIGVTRQYVSKVINKQSMEQQGFGCVSSQIPINKGEEGCMAPQPKANVM